MKVFYGATYCLSGIFLVSCKPYLVVNENILIRNCSTTYIFAYSNAAKDVGLVTCLDQKQLDILFSLMKLSSPNSFPDTAGFQEMGTIAGKPDFFCTTCFYNAPLLSYLEIVCHLVHTPLSTTCLEPNSVFKS